MGQAALKALGLGKICEYCAKYVCNAMTIHSECCECCLLDFHTDEVEVSRDEVSDVSVDAPCFHYHRGKE